MPRKRRARVSTVFGQRKHSPACTILTATSSAPERRYNHYCATQPKHIKHASSTRTCCWRWGRSIAPKYLRKLRRSRHLIAHCLLQAGTDSSQRGQISEGTGNHAKGTRQWPRIPPSASITILRSVTFMRLSNSPIQPPLCYQRALDNAKLLIGAFSDNSLHHLRVGKAALASQCTRSGAKQNWIWRCSSKSACSMLGKSCWPKANLLDLKKDRKAAREQYQQMLGHADRISGKTAGTQVPQDSV